jgi:ribosomal protein L37AE/L43A
MPIFSTTKETECPKCGAKKAVKVMVTKVTCDKCGNQYIVFAIPYPSMPRT